jgi:hypothetical protein
VCYRRMAVSRPKTRRWWMYLGLGGFGLLIVGFLAFVLVKVASIFVGAVPPISGRVVDAVSGKPVAGMDVCLEAAVIDWETRKVVRSEVTRSDASGEFSFSSSIHRTEGFQRWEGFLITVTDPNAEMVPTCGDALIPAFSTFTVALNEGRTWAPINSRKPVYFPVELAQERGIPNPVPWGPLHQKMKHFWGGEIALIPLLQNAEECQGIRDVSLVPFCREMNRSAVASLLRQGVQQASGTQ